MKNSLFSFEKLEAWKSAKELVIAVYELTGKFPSYEKYALSNQIQRAVVSVSSNIAEGNGRISIKERLHFIAIAYGSLVEAYSQLLIAVDLGYISTSDLLQARSLFDRTGYLLSRLSNALTKQLRNT